MKSHQGTYNSPHLLLNFLCFCHLATSGGYCLVCCSGIIMSCDGSKHLGFEEAPVPTLLEGTRLHIKPDADVSQLFEEFNQRFFWGKLLYVEVRWSPRMTL